MWTIVPWQMHDGVLGLLLVSARSALMVSSTVLATQGPHLLKPTMLCPCLWWLCVGYPLTLCMVLQSARPVFGTRAAWFLPLTRQEQGNVDALRRHERRFTTTAKVFLSVGDTTQVLSVNP